jgi:zinc protease
MAATRDAGFTQAELEQHRVGLVNQRRLQRAQDASVAAQLAQNLHLKRTFALSQRVDTALEKLTLADVNAAFRKYADPARWSIAWGGDFKGP